MTERMAKNASVPDLDLIHNRNTTAYPANPSAGFLRAEKEFCTQLVCRTNRAVCLREDEAGQDYPIGR